MSLHRLSLALTFVGAQLAGAQAAPHIVVTPSALTVIAGDSLRLRAQLIDASGAVVPNATMMFRPAGAPFEATVDSTGLVRSGATGT